MDPQPGQPSTIVLADLPNEMIVAVLRQLNLPDLVNCRSVSKQLRDLIDAHLRIRELALFDCKRQPEMMPPLDATLSTPNVRWFLQGNYEILKSPSFLSFFSTSLRSLTILDTVLSPIGDLNRFCALERLYAGTVLIGCGDRLSLPELRVLFVGDTLFRPEVSVEETIRVDSKLVERLVCRELGHIKLTDCDAVKHLQISDIHVYYSKLTMFRRVRVLVISRFQPFHWDRSTRSDAISALKDLTELHFNWNCLLTPRLRTLVDQTVNQIWTKRPALRVFLFGIELTRESSTRLITREISRAPDIFQMQVDNYPQLSVMLQEYWATVWYDRLPIFQNRTLPADFFRKFCNIRCLMSGRLDDPEHFVWFINSCPDLNFLNLNVTGLERAFFGRLSLNRLSLHYLFLSGQNPEMDYQFVHKLDYLWSLKICQALDSRTIISFFEECKYLKRLEFMVDDDLFFAFKAFKDSYSLKSDSDFRYWPVLSSSELVDLCRLLFRESILTRSGAKRLKVNAYGNPVVRPMN